MVLYKPYVKNEVVGRKEVEHEGNNDEGEFRFSDPEEESLFSRVIDGLTATHYRMLFGAQMVYVIMIGSTCNI